MIKGICVSLTKLKNRRQSLIMEKSREKFPSTVKVIKEWRKQRKTNCFLDILLKHDSNLEMYIDETDYYMLRDFLIVEMTIPNCQRPGVIQGITINEVRIAQQKPALNGLHKISITSHKTGHIHHATLFLYSDIFQALVTFIDAILPKLPVHREKISHLVDTSSLFQTFQGQPLNTSRITPILRRFLLTLGIKYSGTITDLRKYAATMTGKFDPSLHEVMALFLGHSRKAHDKYYRINLGHDGLSHAFTKLESFQSISDEEEESSGNVNTDRCYLGPLNETCVPVRGNDNINVTINSSNSLHASYLPSFSNAVNSDNIDSDRCIDDDDFCLILPESDDNLDSSENEGNPPHDSDVHLKDVKPEISITDKGEMKCRRAYRKRSIFSSKAHEVIFARVFREIIKRITDNVPVTKRDVILKSKDKMFEPVLKDIISRYSDEAYIKLTARVRTLGLVIRNERFSK